MKKDSSFKNISKDSTIVDIGGLVFKEVHEFHGSDTGSGNTIKSIEKFEHGPDSVIRPVVGMYFFFAATILILLAISFWYYIRSRTEIAKLMIQNNMQPGELFGSDKSEKKGINKTLKYGIVLISLGIAFLINYFLQLCGLHELQFVVLLLSIGVCLLIINKLNQKVG